MTDAHDQQLARRRRELAKRYEQQEARPAALNMGQPHNATQTAEKAHQQGAGSNHPPELTTLLSTIAPDQQIPDALCTAVASLVVWLQQLDEQHADESRPPSK